VIDSSIDDMLARWNRLDASRHDIDIVSEMMKVTLTIAARVFFSTDVERETAVIETALADVLQDTWRRIHSPIDLASVSSMFFRQRFRRALRQIDGVVYHIIEDRKRAGGGSDDLLSALLGGCEAGAEHGFSDRELRDAVVTLLLAGHETTANALAWTFYLVAGAPQIESRLRAEALHAPASGPPSLVEAGNAFSEAIRIYPSIWIIERRATVTDHIGGYRIPRGSTLLVSPYLLHRHRQWWIDPEKFDPDRFANAQGESRPRNAYLPFGVGPHKCIGEHLAMMVATRVLSRVYREFSPRLVSNQAPELVPGITLRHRSEMRMTLHHIAETDDVARSERT
jgi:cytochrome P450